MTWAGKRFEHAVAAGGWLTAASYHLGLQGSLTIKRYTIEIAEWLSDAPSVRLVFASDFHAGAVTDSRVLQEAAAAIAATQPDVLLLGGDFVSLEETYLDQLVPLLGAIPAPRGRYAVLGNHDYMADASRVAAGLAAGGVTLLTNRHAAIGTPGQPLSIVGLDDDLLGDPDAAAAFAGAGPVTALMMHSPSSLLDVADYPFQVALSGHVHGGQVALPGGKPIFVPGGRLSRRYSHGRFELDPKRTLLVSRGVGCTALPLRLFAPPDVIVCTLVASVAPGER